MRSLLMLLIDLAFVVAFTPLVTLLADRLRERSAENALLVFGVYLLLCGAVYLLRRTATGTAPPEGAMWLLAVQGLFFGIFVGYMAWESSGLLDGLDHAGPSVGQYGPFVAVLAGIALAFLYPALLAAPIEANLRLPSIAQQALGPAVLVILNVAAMLVFAFWDVIFADTTPYDDIGFGGKLLVFAATYVFYWLFFAAPRVAPLALDFSAVSLAAALLSSGSWVWRSLDRLAW